MRPELRRSLILAAALSLALAAGALWLAGQFGPAAPAPTSEPGAVTATHTLLAVEISAAQATESPKSLSTATSPAASPAVQTATGTVTPTPFVAGGAAEPNTDTGDTSLHFPAVFVPGPTATPGPVNPPTGSDWRAFLAYYRAVARLAPLAENTGWSDGAFKHARYLVENDVNTSGEDAALAWYTSEGAAAGPNSLWQLRGEANWNDVQTFDNWMRWPFHALSIIDPALHSFGYGRYSEPGADPGPFHTGAVLDVNRGQGTPNTAYPVMWPSHNTAVYLTSYDGGEQPDPLTSCSGIGLNGPAGLPILLQVGPGSAIGPATQRPVVTAHSFQENGAERDHCIFDETTYQNSITSLRDEGRALLAARDAIVLIPRVPLTAGKSYTVSITANGQVHTWTFQVVNKP
jgi:uncharacterized protein YkwD